MKVTKGLQGLLNKKVLKNMLTFSDYQHNECLPVFDMVV